MPGDVVRIDDRERDLDLIEVAFFSGDVAMVRRWGPPTRDRLARRTLVNVVANTPVECIECPECDPELDDEKQCPACDGTRVIGLFF